MPPKQVKTADFRSIRPQVLGAIKSPLGFFGLALLIVESFLVGAGAFFGLPLEYKIAAIIIGVALFLIVFGTVVWLVVKHPQKLVFSEQSHIAMAALTYGDDTNAEVAWQAVENMPNPSDTVQRLPPMFQQGSE